MTRTLTSVAIHEEGGNFYRSHILPFLKYISVIHLQYFDLFVACTAFQRVCQLGNVQGWIHSAGCVPSF